MVVVLVLRRGVGGGAKKAVGTVAYRPLRAPLDQRCTYTRMYVLIVQWCIPEFSLRRTDYSVQIKNIKNIERRDTLDSFGKRGIKIQRV